MGGERLKIILSLTPPLLIIFTLFFGGIFYGFLQSLGYQPAIGKYEINFSALGDHTHLAAITAYLWLDLPLMTSVSFVLIHTLFSVQAVEPKHKTH